MVFVSCTCELREDEDGDRDENENEGGARRGEGLNPIFLFCLRSGAEIIEYIHLHLKHDGSIYSTEREPEPIFKFHSFKTPFLPVPHSDRQTTRDRFHL